uniref:Uncharacterized protein n=1 Tax=Arundo donax TaxID=35708 RepID=A0A0A9HK83_ARUDO
MPFLLVTIWMFHTCNDCNLLRSFISVP